MTTALKPGAWYNTLLGYKTVNKQLGWILAGFIGVPPSSLVLDLHGPRW